MGRRGNPYDKAKAESFMKTLKVEAVYLTPATLARTFTATADRLRNPDQLRRSSVAPSALIRQSQP
jgi:putative transposase